MEIRIDNNLLEEQIGLCIVNINNSSSEEERGLFEGIENLLSTISYCLENGESVELEIAEDDDYDNQ